MIKISERRANGATLTWDSSNKAAATVDSTGKVTAVDVGKSTKTVSDGAGGTGSCEVEVTAAGGSGGGFPWNVGFSAFALSLVPLIRRKKR